MTSVLVTILSLYAVGMAVFLISENRRPQATLAWLLVLVFAPGLGLVIYVLFGRDTKAFSKRSKLLMQDLEPQGRQLLAPVLSRQDAEIARLETRSPGHRRLMMLVRRNSHSALTTRNRVEVRQDAAEFYPSLIADLKAARHSIHLQYFIWRADEFTAELHGLLAAKAKEGVEVRLLYDPLGSQAYKRKHRAYRKAMEADGIRTAPTSPLWRLHTISYRNHRKITVIDGAIGYTGGMNIGMEHIDGGKGFTSWRDTQVRIVGDGAALLQATFAVDWYNAVRENLLVADYFPRRATAADPAAGEGGSAADGEPDGKDDDDDDDVPVQILTSGPDSQWAAIRQLYSMMIATAERRVRLQSPYFVLDADVAAALSSAALSGVEVQVMLSARASGDPVPGWAGNTYVLDVVNAGVRVFLYNKGYLHAKTMCADSRICSIGSANVDIRSFSINYELNAVIYCDRVARELERAFERDLADCTEFDVAEYRRRNPAGRFRDSVVRLFSPLL